MMHDYDQRQEFDPPQPEPPTYFWWIFLVVILGVIMLSIGYARGDEPARPFVITLYLPGQHYDVGKEYDPNRRTHFVLGVDEKPVVYQSKVACDVAITRVRVHLSGARLQCNPQR